MSPDIVLRTSFHSIATYLNAQEASTSPELVTDTEDMQVDAAHSAQNASNGRDTTAQSNVQTNSAQVNGIGQNGGAEHSAAQDEIIKKVMQELVFHSRAEVSVCCSCYELSWNVY